jgi:predicted nuclease with TOPRIM domain
VKGQDREWYAQELARVLDDIDDKEAAIREEMKERRGEVAKLRKRAKELRDVVSGKRGAQLDFGGANGAAVRVLADVRKDRDP